MNCNEVNYSEIESIVINTWIQGLSNDKDFNKHKLLQALEEKDLPQDIITFAQGEADIIIEWYYEQDRIDAELEALYYPLPN